jgi:hypothetical protein
MAGEVAVKEAVVKAAEAVVKEMVAREAVAWAVADWVTAMGEVVALPQSTKGHSRWHPPLAGPMCYSLQPPHQALGCIARRRLWLRYHSCRTALRPTHTHTLEVVPQAAVRVVAQVAVRVVAQAAVRVVAQAVAAGKQQRPARRRA